ncbi:pitrilysin family protein [Mucilaginibacter sp. PAMB04274]|uniref:M16 family metallopeptidase n=1 Tax=Mucilaginibacter sp. PAMB04274 TaxID=3138568 RepID=UPI0031F6482E
MKKSLRLMFALLAASATTYGQAKLVQKVTKTGTELVIPYEKYVLPNGLTVILHEDHSDPLVHVDVTYHVGSAREEIGKSGFAHFFEHMMFEGSDHALKGVHDKITIGNGGTNNGSTNHDRTNYYETVPANLLENTIWLEADRMGFLLGQVTQDRFEVQRATVKNERGQNYDNRPYGLVSQYYSKNLYPYGHPYSWLTIGYIEDLNRSNVNDLKNFFMRWYGPNNATLTIGGDFQTASTLKMIEKYFGSIPRGPEVKPVAVPAVSLTANRYASYTDNYARLPMLAMVYPTVPNFAKDMPAIDCLAEILGQGKNSVLYQTVVKKQLALQASAYSSNDELAGEFVVQLVPLPGKTLADMEQLYRASLDSLEKRGITDEDIEKFKGSMLSQFINGLQSVSGKVSQLAEYQTYTGNPNMTASQLKAYTSLTKQDVINAYNKYIKNKGAVVLSVLTKGQNVTPAKADNFTVDTTQYKAPNYGYAGLKYNRPKDNFDRSQVPPIGASPVTKAPVFWQKTLSPGVQVIGSENNEVPVVTLNISIPGGRLADAANLSKAGLASFFTAMMGEDTRQYSAERFAAELQKLGSSIRVSNDVDAVVFQVQSLKTNLPKTMALLQERMLSPKFTQEAFDRLKKQRLESFKLLKAQPAAIANSVFAKLNYGGNNVLGLPESGTEQTVTNITFSDIQSYYDNFMTANGAKVVVVGDVKEPEVITQLAFLGKLSNKKVTLAAPAAALPVAKTKIYIVDVPKAAQTQFSVGYGNNLRYNPTGDYYKAYMANYPLGTDFTSRLNTYLRETKGWTYGARSTFSADKYAGSFAFSSGIRAASTDSALVALMTELKNFSTNGPTAEEVTFLKKAISQGNALRYETGFQKARFISLIQEYNLPADYITRQTALLNSMTQDQLKTVAHQYILPGQMNILLVGDKARILPGLQKLGYEIVELNTDGDPATAGN